MRYVLKNEHLQVAVDSLGAELKNTTTADGAREYLWQADPDFWGRTSPILFPIVGRLTDNSAFVDGQPISISQHGFARDRVFECVSETADALRFELNSSVETRTQYPFDFKLVIGYTLRGDELSVDWEVHNTGSGTMPFSIGAHPGFSTELESGDVFEDFDILFDQGKQYYLWPVTDQAQLDDRAIPFQGPLSEFALSYRYFEKDALVFPNMQLSAVTLKSRKHGHGVRVDFPGFPEVALWTQDGKNKRAPFLCIEPWYGHADTAGGPFELRSKPGICLLAGKCEFKAGYKVRFF